jgi:hypothetical protein
MRGRLVKRCRELLRSDLSRNLGADHIAAVGPVTFVIVAHLTIIGAGLGRAVWVQDLQRQLFYREREELLYV